MAGVLAGRAAVFQRLSLNHAIDHCRESGVAQSQSRKSVGHDGSCGTWFWDTHCISQLAKAILHRRRKGQHLHSSVTSIRSTEFRHINCFHREVLEKHAVGSKCKAQLATSDPSSMKERTDSELSGPELVGSLDRFPSKPLLNCFCQALVVPQRSIVLQLLYSNTLQSGLTILRRCVSCSSLPVSCPLFASLVTFLERGRLPFFFCIFVPPLSL
jgi:hypothetical protein